MPSFLHESLAEFFRLDPTLAPRLLRELWGIRIPEGPIEIAEAKLGQIAPVEYHADLVLLIAGKQRYAVIVEVQLRRQKHKPAAWLAYLALLHRTLDAQVLLLVVTPKASVERWASTAYTIGHPGLSLKPLVLGPKRIPVITDVSVAQRSPQLAVLSALTHGRGPKATEVVLTAAQAAASLDEASRKIYYELTGLRVQVDAREHAAMWRSGGAGPTNAYRDTPRRPGAA